MTPARNWRQVPEIQEAKRAALALKASVAIVLYITEDGEFGYASYGTNGRRCELAGKFADVAYEAILRHVQLGKVTTSMVSAGPEALVPGVNAGRLP